MPQGVLPFLYEVEKRASGMTALAGLPTYLEHAHVSGLTDSINRHLHLRDDGRGWTDRQVVMSLVMLNLAGGDCVDDLTVLESDAGFAEVLRRVETHGMPRQQRRTLELQWRKERTRSVPSPSAVFRYLDGFHDEAEEKKRADGPKAFIPQPNEALRGLNLVNRDFLAFVQSRSPQKHATLDQDATLVETHKREALYCYKHFKSYQPLNSYWAEQDLLVHSEFRDGNVPAGYEQVRVLTEALANLPAGVEKVFLRSDTAGYQYNVLDYCAKGSNERFGVIEFAIGADVTPEFKAAVSQVAETEWHPLCRKVEVRRADGRVEVRMQPSGQEWAEVCFVTNRIAHSEKNPEYRYLAIRESLQQLDLPKMEEAQQSLPFPTHDFGAAKGRCKLFGVVTNRTLPGDELIWWLRARCGKSEEVHSVQKEDLAGGRLPCGEFGANAAWWAIMILAYNLNSAMKRLVLKGDWVTKRLKAIRFWLVAVPGRVVRRARQLVIRLTDGHPSNSILLGARRRNLHLALESG